MEEKKEGLLVGFVYKMGERIGKGAFGQIYYGSNIQTGQEVAIKLVFHKKMLIKALGTSKRKKPTTNI